MNLFDVRQRLFSGFVPQYMIALAGAGILAVTPLRLLGFALLLVIFARLLFIQATFLAKLVLAFVICAAGTALLSLVAWLYNVPLTSSAVLLCLIIVTGIYAFLFSERLVPLKPSRQELFEAEDLVALGLAVVAGTFVMLPVFQAPSTPKIGQVVLFNGDNSTHIELVKANDLNQGVSYGLGNRVNSFVDAANYPQGWHFFTAFLKWMVDAAYPSVLSAGKILAVYYATCVIWLMVFIFLLTRFGLVLGRQLVGKRRRLFALIAPGGILLITSSGWLITLFAYGFQTQIAASTLLIAELWVLQDAFYNQAAAKRGKHFKLAMLLAASVAFMWIFLIPVAVLILGASYILTFKKTRRTPPIGELVCMVSLGLLVLLQLGFRALFPLRHVQSDSYLNSFGLVTRTDLNWLLVPILIIIIFLILSSLRRYLALVSAALLIAVVFSLVILIYQLSTVGEPRYFYYKANITIILLTLILMMAIVYKMSDSLFALVKSSVLKRYGMAAILLIIAGLVAWPVRATVAKDYLRGSAIGLDIRQSEAILELVEKNPKDGYRIISIGSCNRGNDIRATQFAWTVAFEPLPSRGQYEPMRMFMHDKYKLFEDIKSFQQAHNTRPLIVINDQVIGEEFKTYLADRIDYFDFKTLDPDMFTESIQQCPDRIRDIQKYPA